MQEMPCHEPVTVKQNTAPEISCCSDMVCLHCSAVPVAEVRAVAFHVPSAVNVQFPLNADRGYDAFPFPLERPPRSFIVKI